MKKAISVFLSLVMLLSITAGLELSAYAEAVLESISYTPAQQAELVENVDGYCDEDGVFYYNIPYAAEGDILTVNYKNGTSTDFVYDYDSDSFVAEDGDLIDCFDVNFYDNQYETPWTVGEDNYYLVSYMGCETQVPITVTENPVESISFTPANEIVFVEGVCDSWEDEDGNIYYFYDVGNEIYCEGNVLTVNYTDGRTVDYTSQWLTYWGDLWTDLSYCDDEGNMIPASDICVDYAELEFGENQVPVSYYGKTAYITVELQENPVESIAYVPAESIELVENTNGYLSEDGVFYYDIPLAENGDILTVNYKDGTSIDFVFDYDSGLFVSEDGKTIDYYDVNYYDNQYETPWAVGEDNYYIVNYMGCETQVPVSVTGNTAVQPEKVTGLYTSARGGYGEQLKISWNAVSGADSYKVYRLVDGKYTAVAATADTSYVFTDLVPGWEYYFKVSAVKNGREGALSDELHTCAACPPMDLPSVVAMDSKTIQVDWNITNAHGYVVQWSTDPDFKTNVNSAYVTGHTSDSYTISVPGSSQNYYVRTRAWRYWENNSLVYGIWTDGIKYGENLEKVTGLYTSARGGYGEQLKISWDKQRDVDFYNVYRLVDGKYTVVATTTDTSYVFTDLVPGWEYYFKVSSVRDGVESVLSDELHTCAACPPIETYSAEINNNGSVTVDWEMVNAHGYVVMWSTDPEFKTDVNYSYVVGHESTTYTFTPNGNAEDYYVRVRAWRYWENNSLVYGIWTDGFTA